MPFLDLRSALVLLRSLPFLSVFFALPTSFPVMHYFPHSSSVQPQQSPQAIGQQVQSYPQENLPSDLRQNVVGPPTVPKPRSALDLPPFSLSAEDEILQQSPLLRTGNPFESRPESSSFPPPLQNIDDHCQLPPMNDEFSSMGSDPLQPPFQQFPPPTLSQSQSPTNPYNHLQEKNHPLNLPSLTRYLPSLLSTDEELGKPVSSSYPSPPIYLSDGYSSSSGDPSPLPMAISPFSPQQYPQQIPPHHQYNPFQTHSPLSQQMLYSTQIPKFSGTGPYPSPPFAVGSCKSAPILSATPSPSISSTDQQPLQLKRLASHSTPSLSRSAGISTRGGRTTVPISKPKLPVGIPPGSRAVRRTSIPASTQRISESPSPQQPWKRRKLWTDEEMERAIRMVQVEKKSARSAAIACGVPRSTLWDRLHALGVVGDKKKRKPEIEGASHFRVTNTPNEKK